MNPIDSLFQAQRSEILSVYFTAGYPHAGSIGTIIELLSRHGADIIEVGLPFSDPLADGPTIQESSAIALRQGITIAAIFRQLSQIKSPAPIVLMGYLNPVLQYGFEVFLRDAKKAGASAIILPDLPPEVFTTKYRHLYEQHDIYPVFLISPQSSDERIRMLDSLSKGFLYAVSSSTTTGKNSRFGMAEMEWFGRIKRLKLNNPVLAGFGIADHDALRFVFDHLHGAVVGSALIKSLDATKSDFGIPMFLKNLLNHKP